MKVWEFKSLFGSAFEDFDQVLAFKVVVKTGHSTVTEASVNWPKRDPVEIRPLKTVEVAETATNKQIMPCRFLNTDMCHAKATVVCRTGEGAKKRFGCYRSSTA